MSQKHQNLHLPKNLKEILSGEKQVIIPETRQELVEYAMGKSSSNVYEVGYEVAGKGYVSEANVVKCKNGLSINYNDEYMRRRDPDSLIVADDKPSDKVKFSELYDFDFNDVRKETFEWLKGQDLILVPFMSGDKEHGYLSLLVAPLNAAFFAAALADLQGFIPKSKLPKKYNPKAVIYLAPPFRHTHFDGKQVVIHNRLKDTHELFSYNLYPGPSAKKGVYGVLLNIGEKEGWVTAHASTVQIVTPYDNYITVMHEGASGGGKSEMIEPLHREPNGQVLLGKNIETGNKRHLIIRETCSLRPVTDDMALCHPSYKSPNKKLMVKDAEHGWFLRINHIEKYGTSPQIENLSIHPKEPLVFLNLQGSPDSTCLIWEHTMDAPDRPCPNPRVIMPRKFVPDVIDEAVEIDVRSFGVRTPPCTAKNPSYGILGMFHILPPGLAWLWRLTSPRGHANPSIVSESGALTSEGVGSYWPFATGHLADQANLLLEQFLEATSTRYILIPNQHIGAYEVGFMPQWITREYLARRGSAKFNPDQVKKSKCSLLGYSMESVKVDGTYIPKDMLQTELQREVGDEGFDAGSKMLIDFFKDELKKFDSSKLMPIGKQIIECCMDDGTVDDYSAILSLRL